MWEILTFVLNSALFVLIGLQLPTVLEALDESGAGDLIANGALVAAAVMLVRIAWVFPLTYAPRLLHRFREAGPPPPWQHTLIVAWTGMRGAVSLAAALAVPLTIDAGGPFPERDEIIFLSFSVILATLVIQGLTLPPLIHLLDVDDADEQLDREESKARLLAVKTALDRLDELVTEEWVREDTVERIRGAYEYRRRRFASRFDDEADSDGFEERSEAYQRLMREVIDAQRVTLLALRDSGKINDEVMRRIERELDLEDSRLEI
jgi:CPA1 family monovalent cation:H+ antiporter